MDLYSFPLKSIEDSLWHQGLNSHRLSSSERLEYIQFLRDNINVLPSKIVVNAMSYLLHSYFYCMTDIEKEQYVSVLTKFDAKHLFDSSDIFEIIGIMFKVCPIFLKRDLLDCVLTNSQSVTRDPSTMISICNCFAYIFDEVERVDKLRILDKLSELNKSNPYPQVDESILFTLDMLNRSMAL